MRRTLRFFLATAGEVLRSVAGCRSREHAASKKRQIKIEGLLLLLLIMA
jgi:hypothetical protein